MKNVSLKYVASILANHAHTDQLVDLAEDFKRGRIAIEGLDVDEVQYPTFPLPKDQLDRIMSDLGYEVTPPHVKEVCTLKGLVKFTLSNYSQHQAVIRALSILVRRNAHSSDIHVLMEREVLSPKDLLWLRGNWPFPNREHLERALADCLMTYVSRQVNDPLNDQASYPLGDE